MVGSRALTALAGLLVSLAVSVGIYLQTGSMLLFLFVPFVPFLFSSSLRREDDDDRPPTRACPECEFRTRESEFEYCPRDGRRLREE
jgi:hypothetical protein